MIRVSWSSHFSIYLVCVTTHLKSYLSTHSFRGRFPLVLTASCAVTDFCRFEQLIALCSCSWNQLVPGLGLEGLEGTHSFPAKSATLARCCRPGSVQSLPSGVQMSAQDGSWIPVYLLPTRLRHLWPSPPSCDRLTVVILISHVWNLLRAEDVHLHTPALRIGTQFLLTLEAVVFLFHLLSTTSKPFSSLSTRLAHAARLGFFYKKTRYINSLLLLEAKFLWPRPLYFGVDYITY